ncbi:hypothetical protein [Pseudomonas sp. PSKL.D1]|uniref:hypothetical protein n=1 Tax=Pseudomonas sp. PSKL.D1 TaxID=3029060 RepID=UPI0023818523|nr:hypothetical protein [Pseudomonas sp. PSKL.D1]WDY60068.1 hypothetical protein PVV54_10740 [Pseudomonas sp. PSKL.D1]
MNFHVPRIVLAGLFAFAAMGSASATPNEHAAPSPFPDVAHNVQAPAATLLAHDDRYWHDGRWHYRNDDRRRDEWRRAQWRREQARREAERRRDWERHHDRAMHHRYDGDHRYYRR